MIKKLSLILMASLLLSAIEVYHVNSSPLLGSSIDLNDLMLREEVLPLLENLTHKENLDLESYNALYRMFYKVRPHANDVTITTIYKVMLLGVDTVDMAETISCIARLPGLSYENADWPRTLSKYVSHGIASCFYPSINVHFLLDEYSIQTMTLLWSRENGPGKMTSSALLCSLTYTLDQFASASSSMFENEAAIELGLSQDAFVQALAELYRARIARLSFVESVLDEKPPWQGICYLSYYPHFGKIWVVTKQIPEGEASDCRVLIDNVEADRTVIFPFVLIDAPTLEEGNHSLELVAGGNSYTLKFYVDPFPIWVRLSTVALFENGTVNFEVANIDLENRTVHLENAWVKVDNFEGQKIIHENLNRFDVENISVNLNRTFENKAHAVEISIKYFLEGWKREHVIRVRRRLGSREGYARLGL